MRLLPVVAVGVGVVVAVTMLVREMCNVSSIPCCR